METIEIDLPLNELNSLIQCSICHGYLVDPQTIRECLDKFCRTCLLLYFEKTSPDDYQCPKCHVHLPPFSDLSKIFTVDRQLNDVLQILIPQLEIDEIFNEKNFYESKSRSLPKDVELRTRLVPELKSMRFVDEQNRIRIRSRPEKLNFSSKNFVALKIEFSKKFVDPTANIRVEPKKYLCLSAELEIGHVRKYLEKFCEISSPFRIYLFFFDSCLNDSTPLLMLKNLLFPSKDRIELFYSIVENK